MRTKISQVFSSNITLGNTRDRVFIRECNFFILTFAFYELWIGGNSNYVALYWTGLKQNVAKKISSFLVLYFILVKKKLQPLRKGILFYLHYNSLTRMWNDFYFPQQKESDGQFIAVVKISWEINAFWSWRVCGLTFLQWNFFLQNSKSYDAIAFLCWRLPSSLI